MAEGRKPRPGPSAYFGEKGWRFIRLWQTLMIVVEAERPLSVPEINDRLALDANLRQYEGKLATTRDDLWLLVRCGFPLGVVDEEGDDIPLDEYLDPDQSRRGKLKNTRWRLRPGGEIGRLDSPRHRRPSSADLTTLSILRALLRDEVPRPYPLYDQLRVLLEELHHWLMSHLRGADRTRMIESFLASGKRSHKKLPARGIVSTIAEALQAGHMVEGVYTLFDGKEAVVQVLPLAAWFSDGRGHLFGARGYDGALRVYRLDRFVSLRVDKERPAPDVDEKEMERLLAGRFGGFIAEPKRIRLLASAAVSYLFDEYEFHPSQSLHRRQDGSLLVTLECAVSYSLEEWILGFGDQIEVLEPPDLRAAIAARLRKACALYANEEAPRTKAPYEHKQKD